MSKLITGGAGFIGINLAENFAKQGEDVIIFDNFSRKGCHQNVKWLVSNYPNIKVVNGDITTDMELMKNLIDNGVTVLYHLASQVAVTKSVEDPKLDFEINILGTINVLEAARAANNPPVLFYSSTNKVYGGMENIRIINKGNKYGYAELPNGISELTCLDFHSPYGCSKGSADQYFRDYSRIYNLKTVVFRQSCIYGERQFGIEDQGWVAWFVIASILKLPITIQGDGRQVRDILYIKDLIRAFDMAYEKISITSGKIYNIGGGSLNTLSLIELINLLINEVDNKLNYKFADWRPGDQKVFISDCSKAKNEFGWSPQYSPEEGVRNLINWVKINHEEIKQLFI